MGQARDPSSLVKHTETEHYAATQAWLMRLNERTVKLLQIWEGLMTATSSKKVNSHWSLVLSLFQFQGFPPGIGRTFQEWVLLVIFCEVFLCFPAIPLGHVSSTVYTYSGNIAAAVHSTVHSIKRIQIPNGFERGDGETTAGQNSKQRWCQEQSPGWALVQAKRESPRPKSSIHDPEGAGPRRDKVRQGKMEISALNTSLTVTYAVQAGAPYLLEYIQ